jgi:hypothetical protein
MEIITNKKENLIMQLDSKIINEKRYHRYEYRGRKTMSLVEAEDGMNWFRTRFTRDFRGRIVGSIRKVKERDGTYSLWYRDREYERKIKRQS